MTETLTNKEAARWLRNLIDAGWGIETVAPSGSPCEQILEDAKEGNLRDD